MITESKKAKVIFFIFSLLCFVAIGVCLICDFAINKEVTWAIYPLTAIPFVWIAITPLLLVKKYKIVCTLLTFSIVVFPFLYFIQFATPIQGWFTPLALPVAIIGVGALWITLFVLKFFTFRTWYLASILVFLYGVIANTMVQYFVSKFVDRNFISIDLVINVFACMVITILTAIIGYSKRKDKKKQA